jgi:hypothetical protein
MAQAIVYVLRRSAYPAGAQAFRIEIDGREMGKLRNGKNIKLITTPGPHKLQIRARLGGHSPVVAINLAEGEEAEFTCCGTMPGSLAKEYIELRQEKWRRPAPVGSEKTVRPKAPMPARVLEFVETRRSEEPTGEENRTIDNLRGNSEVTRVIRVSRDWSRSVSIVDSKAREKGGGFSAGPQWATLRAEIKNTLQKNYTVSSDIRETHAEEITLQVPAGSCVQLSLRWKRIVQHGFVRVQDESGNVVEIPFKVGIAVTFDQIQQQLL